MTKTTWKLFIIIVVALLATQFVVLPIVSGVIKPKSATVNK